MAIFFLGFDGDLLSVFHGGIFSAAVFFFLCFWALYSLRKKEGRKDGWMDGWMGDEERNNSLHIAGILFLTHPLFCRDFVQPCEYVVAAMGVLLGVWRDGVAMGVG